MYILAPSGSQGVTISVREAFKKKTKIFLTNVKIALTPSPPLNFDKKTIFIFMPEKHFLTNSKNM